MDNDECKHDWIVTVDNDNYLEDIICSKCKEVVVMLIGDQAAIRAKDVEDD